MCSARFLSTFDVVIVGGGVTGTSLLYSLAHFTDLKRLALVERRNALASVASGPNNNSQTIHCGDIETNYTPTKSAAVHRHANMLRNYITKLPLNQQDKCARRLQKMAIAVGDDECHLMETRFRQISSIFPKLQLISKAQVEKFEPNVVLGRNNIPRPDRISAVFSADEHTAVNYFHLASSFVGKAKEISNKQVAVLMPVEVSNIKQRDDGLLLVSFRHHKPIIARFVVVAACGHSLLFAQKMGFGLNFSCLPTAGSFYFGPNVLRGKVYTVQNPELPFAAVHGDPDLIAHNKTRFGPTAIPLPLLERYNLSSFPDFLRVFRPDMALATVYFNLLKNATVRNYIMRNFLFEVPVLNRRLFSKDVQKICPAIHHTDLVYAHGFGGVRPQLIDKSQKKLILGEGKILSSSTNVIFNITPSPGGTTCLGTAEGDLRRICTALGGSIDEGLLKKTLFEGEYPVD